MRKNTSHTRIHHVLDQTERTFQILVSAIIRKNLLDIKESGENGAIQLTDLESLNRQCMPVLRRIPLNSSLTLANSVGTEYLLYDDGLSWRTRFFTVGEDDAVWTRWEGIATITETWTERIVYDPRSQAWYQGATEHTRGDVYWLMPTTILPASNEHSISGAIRWEWQEQTYIATLHTPLHPIFVLMAILSGSKEGYIFLPTENDPIIISPSDRPEIEGNVQGESNISQTEGLVNAEISKFVEDWHEQELSRLEVTHFTIDEESWWAGISLMELGQQTFPIGIAIPEQDLAPDIQRDKTFLFYTIVSPAIVVLILLAIQARFFLRMLRELGQQQFDLTEDEEQKLRGLIQQGESLTQEFKSTLRWNLKTGKPGKEIELAWLKTVVAYLNTKGGKIFIGVRDDGEIFGLEADHFKNDDKLLLHVNNLIKQHIGLEFSRYITVELHTLDERNILVITCETSPEPVFLKHNNEELFYIRTGPASIKLSLSEVLKYVAHRQTMQNGYERKL